MQPVMHKTTNSVAQPPAGLEDCVNLPLTVGISADGYTVLTSYWQPSPAELEALNANGRVLLMVIGNVQPVVAVGVDQ